MQQHVAVQPKSFSLKSPARSVNILTRRPDGTASITRSRFSSGIAASQSSVRSTGIASNSLPFFTFREKYTPRPLPGTLPVRSASVSGRNARPRLSSIAACSLVYQYTVGMRRHGGSKLGRSPVLPFSALSTCPREGKGEQLTGSVASKLAESPAPPPASSASSSSASLRASSPSPCTESALLLRSSLRRWLSTSNCFKPRCERENTYTSEGDSSTRDTSSSTPIIRCARAYSRSWLTASSSSSVISTSCVSGFLHRTPISASSASISSSVIVVSSAAAPSAAGAAAPAPPSFAAAAAAACSSSVATAPAAAGSTSSAAAASSCSVATAPAAARSTSSRSLTGDRRLVLPLACCTPPPSSSPLSRPSPLRGRRLLSSASILRRSASILCFRYSFSRLPLLALGGRDTAGGVATATALRTACAAFAAVACRSLRSELFSRTLSESCSCDNASSLRSSPTSSLSSFAAAPFLRLFDLARMASASFFAICIAMLASLGPRRCALLRACEISLSALR